MQTVREKNRFSLLATVSARVPSFSRLLRFFATPERANACPTRRERRDRCFRFARSSLRDTATISHKFACTTRTLSAESRNPWTKTTSDPDESAMSLNSRVFRTFGLEVSSFVDKGTTKVTHFDKTFTRLFQLSMRLKKGFFFSRIFFFFFFFIKEGIMHQNVQHFSSSEFKDVTWCERNFSKLQSTPLNF